jgi:hypothetical protein
MSKEKFLILKKTLIKLLNKGFIRASNFLTGALVFFIKKLNGGVWFYINYKVLNIIT